MSTLRFTDDPAQVPPDELRALLDGTYWAKGRTLAVTRRVLSGSYLVVGVFAVLALAWGRVMSKFSEGSKVAVAGSLLASMNTASEYGFGGVIAALPGFAPSITSSAASAAETRLEWFIESSRAQSVARAPWKIAPLLPKCDSNGVACTVHGSIHDSTDPGR